MFIKLTAVFLTSIILVGCGGGGGSTEAPQSTTTDTTTDTTQIATDPIVPPTDTGNIPSTPAQDTKKWDDANWDEMKWQ